mgnify:CR=1 FL=1
MQPGTEDGLLGQPTLSRLSRPAVLGPPIHCDELWSDLLYWALLYWALLYWVLPYRDLLYWNLLYWDLLYWDLRTRRYHSDNSRTCFGV